MRSGGNLMSHTLVHLIGELRRLSLAAKHPLVKLFWDLSERNGGLDQFSMPDKVRTVCPDLQPWFPVALRSLLVSALTKHL